MNAPRPIRWIRLLILLISCSMAAPMVASCGGGSKSAAGKRKRRKKKKKVEEQPQADAEDIDNWTMVQPYFNRFVDASLTGFKDPFRPQLVEHVGKQEVIDEVRSTIGTVGGSSRSADDDRREIPKGPLQRYPLSAYRVILIQTGTAEPKAVLEDPSAQAFPVTRDTYVGSEGGYVYDITQYYVLFHVPDEPEKLIKSLKPDLLDQIGRVGTGDYLSVTPGKTGRLR